jgi:hypothetical protein
MRTPENKSKFLTQIKICLYRQPYLRLKTSRYRIGNVTRKEMRVQLQTGWFNLFPRAIAKYGFIVVVWACRFLNRELSIHLFTVANRNSPSLKAGCSCFKWF